MGKKIIYENGIIINNLKYIVEIGKLKNHRKGKFECFCGVFFISEISNVKRGNTNSCGCLNRLKSSIRFKKHGYSCSSLYPIHNSMMNRCYSVKSSSYKYYGKAGIEVCKEWHDIESFIKWAKNNGYENGLTIERIKNSKGYNPNNCKWIPKHLQGVNRITTILNVNDVMSIKKILKNKNYTSIKSIASKYNVSSSTISDIKNKRSWKHVNVRH